MIKRICMVVMLITTSGCYITTVPYKPKSPTEPILVYSHNNEPVVKEIEFRCLFKSYK